MRYEVYNQVTSGSEESEARSMHDSMPDLATDSISENENLLSPDSNETDSGNSELQWGDPQIIWQPEFSGEVAIGLTDSDDDGNVLWGSLSTSSNETQHESDDGVVLGISEGVVGRATSDSDSVEMVLNEYLESVRYGDDVVQLNGIALLCNRGGVNDDDLSNDDIGFGSVSNGSNGDGGAQLLYGLEHTVSDAESTDACCEDLDEASIDHIGDASNGRSRIQVEENDCLLGNPTEPDQF